MTAATAVSELWASIQGAPTPTRIPTIPRSKELPEDMVPTLRGFEDAKALAKWANAQKEMLEADIRSELDGALVGTINGIEVVRVVDSHNTHYDGEVLKETFPEAAAAAERRTDYDYLRTTAPR